jgi:tRNA A37 methylthiotransferase MiaB
VSPSAGHGFLAGSLYLGILVRFFIINLGCPKNLVDGEGMAALLQAAGHRYARAPRHADVIIVNTCGFIAAARAESLATLRQAARDKRPGQMLVAAGCLAEREGAGLARRVPGIDACIGTRHWSQIVPLVDQIVPLRAYRKRPNRLSQDRRWLRRCVRLLRHPGHQRPAAQQAPRGYPGRSASAG